MEFSSKVKCTMLMIHHSCECDMWSRGEWDPHSSSSFLINFSIKWKSWRTFIANYKNSMTHSLTWQYASVVLSWMNIQNLQFFRKDILIRHLWNKSSSLYSYNSQTIRTPRTQCNFIYTGNVGENILSVSTTHNSPAY